MNKETSLGLIHVHSHYSLLAPEKRARTLAISSVEDLVAQAAQGGHQAIGLTDDQTLFGLGELYAATEKHRIKPIPGIELPIQIDGSLSSATILALNQAGLLWLFDLANQASLTTKSIEIDRVVHLPESVSATVVLRYRDDHIHEILTADHIYWGADNYEPNTLSFAESIHLHGGKSIVSHQVVMAQPHQGKRYQQLQQDRDYSSYRQPHRPFQFLHHTVKSGPQLWQAYQNIPEALDHLADVVNRAEVALPKFPPPKALSAGEQDSYSYLEETVYQSNYYQENHAVIQTKVASEMALIKQFGLFDYLLICREIAEFCRQEEIIFTVSGSGNNSMVLHALGVTNVDPTELLTERFINEARHYNLPDVDFLISEDGRQRLDEWLVNRYGAVYLSVIHHHRQDPLKVGLPYKVSRHPSGLLVFQGDLPVWKDTQVQADKNTIEAILNIAKYDFPVDPAASLLQDTLDYRQLEGKDREQDYTDSAVADSLKRADTLSLPYVDSPHMQRVLTQTMADKPMTINSLAQALAVARPESQARQIYRDRYWQQDNPLLHYPEILDILGKTNHTIIYQEQILEIAMDLAGMTIGQANQLRKMMSENAAYERRLEMLTELGQNIRDRGYPDSVSTALEKQLQHFVSYGFMEGHALSLAQLIWDLAYQREHHPQEYWAAVLKRIARKGSHSYHPQAYLNELHRQKNEVVFPQWSDLPEYPHVVEDRLLMGSRVFAGARRVSRKKFKREYVGLLQLLDLYYHDELDINHLINYQRQHFKLVVTHPSYAHVREEHLFSPHLDPREPQTPDQFIVGQLVLSSRTFQDRKLLTLDSQGLIHTSVEHKLLKSQRQQLYDPHGRLRLGQLWECRLSPSSYYNNWYISEIFPQGTLV